MKKVLLSLAVVAALGMTSCGGADMCACATDMMDLGKQMESADDAKKEELMKEFEAKAKECEAMGKEMEEGKTDEEKEAMKKDLMDNCEALKDMPH